MAPHSNAWPTRRTVMAPDLRSTATSAQAATQEPFSVPQARPNPTLGAFLAARPAQPNFFMRVR